MTPDEISKLRDRLKQKHGLDDLDLYPSGDDIELHKLVVPKGRRSQGIGSAVMRDLNAAADASGKRVVLDLAGRGDRWGTTSKARLRRFYTAHGFTSNHGRGKDYRLSREMYRNPQAVSKPGKIREREHPYIKSAKKHFGLARHIGGAGYLTPRGELIDFSGAREGGRPEQRAYDHRQIHAAPGIPSHPESHSESMTHFMRETGSIRVMANSKGTDLGFDMVHPPTRAQLSTIRRVTGHDADLRFDVRHPDTFEVEHTVSGTGRDFHNMVAGVNRRFRDRGVQTNEMADELIAQTLMVYLPPEVSRPL